MMGMYPPEWKRRMKMEGLTPQQLWQEEEDRRRAEQRKSEEAREAARKQAKLSVYYYHTDHLGTPRELTDSQGNIRWSATYKAWGNTLKMEWVEEADAQAAPVEQAIRFQGQWYDAETGLHYNRFRYYDPDIGRFISQDPIGLHGGDNLYQYAPNPLSWIDPYGLKRGSSKKKQGSADPSAGTPGKTCPHSNVVNALKNYQSKRYQFGNNTFLLDKAAMTHILKRHHPEYWDGSVKSKQTYLCAETGINNIENEIESVMKENAAKLRGSGATTGMYQISGGNGRTVGLNSGRIGQYY